jgi:hypothetical protein
MPDIHDVMDVTMDDLSPEQQIQLKDAIDQFQQKCLMSFGKNRSGVPYLKTDTPRVLLPREPDTTSAEEKQEAMNAFRQTMKSIIVKHHTVFFDYVQADVGGSKGRLIECHLKHLLGRLEKLVLLEMQVLSPLCKVRGVSQSSRLRGVWEVNRSSHPYKALAVVQSNNRTLIRQSLTGPLMEIWHSVLLEFHPSLLIE